MALSIFFAEYLSGLAPGPVDPALLAQGLAMRDAVLADLRGCRFDGRAPEITCPAPGEAGASPLDFVARAAREHDAVWIVAPETGDLLAQLSEAVPAGRWIGCDTGTLRIAASKSGTTALLHERSVLTPRAFENDAGVGAWVVKPDDGVGAADARRHGSRAAAEADLAARREAGADAVLEPWVDGEAMSLSLLCAGGQAELLSINRQSIDIGDRGWLVEQGVEPLAVVEPALAAAADRLAQAVASALPGLAGFAGIDFVQHPARGPVLVEINPRVTSAYAGARARTGRNLAQAVLEAWLRGPAPRRAGS